MGILNRHRSMTRPLFVLVVTAVVVFAVARLNQAQTAPTSGRSPVITNQFSSTSGGALQSRSPGRQVQQGLAAANGTSNFIVGDAVNQQGFFAETIEIIFLDMIDQISQILSGLNLLTGGNPLSGLLGGTGGTGGLGSLFNGLTGGTGSVPIQ